jgi:hypothetical protein
MFRDEKGRFVSNDKSDETKANVSYGYYSKLLNKPFDTVEELQKAEDEFKAAEEAKKAKSIEKKTDASKVEDAFKALNAAKKTFNTVVGEAKKEYAKVVADAKSVYANKTAEASKSLEIAEEAYNIALKEFNDKHPEGYHMTLRDGDNVTEISRFSSISDVFGDLNDLYKSFESFFEIF